MKNIFGLWVDAKLWHMSSSFSQIRLFAVGSVAMQQLFKIQLQTVLSIIHHIQNREMVTPSNGLHAIISAKK